MSYHLGDPGSIISIQNTPKTQRVLVNHTFVFVYMQWFGLPKSVQFKLKSSQAITSIMKFVVLYAK